MKTRNRMLAGVSALALIVAGCGTGRTDENQIDDNTTEVIVNDNEGGGETDGERKIREIDDARDDNNPSVDTP